jgi:hypothetical protein
MNLPVLEPKDTSISKIGEYYENGAGPALTACLALIDPTFGVASAIGGLLSYGNSQRSKLKQGYLAHKIKEQLDGHKEEISSINENLHEAISLAVHGLESTVSTEKIDRFAKIISGHIIENSIWDETATALRTIANLEDIHIEILSNASLCYDHNNKQAKFYIETPDFPKPGMIDGRSIEPSINILDKLNNRSHAEVRMFCMELMSKGLIHNNGQGAFSKGPVFTLTDAAFWLLTKIEDIKNS